MTDKKLFNKADRKFGTKSHTVYQAKFLAKKAYEDSDMDEIKSQLENKWQAFMGHDMKRITKHITNARD